MVMLWLSYSSLQYAQPSIAGYEFGMDHYAKAVYQSLTNLLLHPHSRITAPSHVMPDFISGGSIERAP